jgi:hypothetical protein
VTARQFDTSTSSSAAAASLTSYLTNVANGIVLVGVTAYDPMTGLSTALTALSALGVSVSDVPVKGSFAFVAQKGRNFQTVQTKAVPESLAAFLDVIVSGKKRVLLNVGDYFDAQSRSHFMTLYGVKLF